MITYSSEINEFSFKVLELKNGFQIQKVRHNLKYISRDNFINHKTLTSEECDNNVMDKDKKISMTHK